jgi:flagellar basal-body rod protein FlgB
MQRYFRRAEEVDKGFNVLEKLMTATNRRHKVLSSNIANSDTPGYKAMDIDFDKYMNDTMMEMKTTDPGHIKGQDVETPKMAGSEDEEFLWGDSNDVEVDMQVAKMTENAMLNSAAARLMSIKITMFKNAVRGR